MSDFVLIVLFGVKKILIFYKMEILGFDPFSTQYRLRLRTVCQGCLPSKCKKDGFASIQVSKLYFHLGCLPNQLHQSKLNHSKPNSSIPKKTQPHLTELNRTKRNSSTPNGIKHDNFQPNLGN